VVPLLSTWSESFLADAYKRLPVTTALKRDMMKLLGKLMKMAAPS
jgi:hypothetical protein